MKHINRPLKTEIVPGQAYVDEPVFVEVSKADPLALDINTVIPAALKRAPFVFGQQADTRTSEQRYVDHIVKAHSKRPRVPQGPQQVEGLIRSFSHYNHVRLNWVKPPNLTP